MKKTGGDTFNPGEGFIYFLASDLTKERHDDTSDCYILAAINQMTGKTYSRVIDTWLDEGKKLFLDSGIFSLASAFSKKSGISISRIFGMQPEEIEGFQELFDKYLSVLKRYKDSCWGYVELDLGGVETKTRYRTKLEEMGYRPIPVYHPLTDDSTYLEHLASTYDRICIGNLAKSSRPIRKRILHAAWETKKRHPGLWIHLLGFTPNEWINALPVDSCDSSTWLSSVRWNGYSPRAAGVPFGAMPREFQYKLHSDKDSKIGFIQGSKMASYGSKITQRNFRNHHDNLTKLGFEL